MNDNISNGHSEEPSVRLADELAAARLLDRTRPWRVDQVKAWLTEKHCQLWHGWALTPDKIVDGVLKPGGLTACAEWLVDTNAEIDRVLRSKV